MKPHFENETINYYDNCADEYARETLRLKLDELYAPFVENLPAGAKILDVGCGSGRDSLYFLKNGFDVTAVDASAAMCRNASQLIGREVAQMRFDEINQRETFDGVWCCAALLHVPKSEVKNALDNLLCTLKFGGVLYVSLKEGLGEKIEDGRFFAYYQLEEIKRILLNLGAAEIIKFWLTGDLRCEKDKQIWINIIIKLKTI